MRSDPKLRLPVVGQLSFNFETVPRQSGPGDLANERLGDSHEIGGLDRKHVMPRPSGSPNLVPI